MHHKYFILETFAPLIIWFSAFTISDYNTIVNSIAGTASALFAVVKLVDHYKKSKTKKHEKI